jgi:iron only hydrogenase large subunit-like protein
MDPTLVAGLTSAGILTLYMLIKKISKSQCHSDSGCIQCDVPTVEIAKQNTERVERLEDLIRSLQVGAPPDRPTSPASRL